MSTEPLLPSYSSIPEYEWERCPYQHRQCRRVNPTPLTRSTSPIQSLSAPFFVGAVITSTYWAYKSYTASDRVFVYLYLTGLRSLTIFPDPIGTCPFTPLLCVVVPRPLFLFVDWLPTLHPLIAHAVIWFEYKQFFPGTKQPNWIIMFLATQAWWDFLLLMGYYPILRII